MLRASFLHVIVTSLIMVQSDHSHPSQTVASSTLVDFNFDAVLLPASKQYAPIANIPLIKSPSLRTPVPVRRGSDAAGI